MGGLFSSTKNEKHTPTYNPTTRATNSYEYDFGTSSSERTSFGTPAYEYNSGTSSLGTQAYQYNSGTSSLGTRAYEYISGTQAYQYNSGTSSLGTRAYEYNSGTSSYQRTSPPVYGGASYASPTPRPVYQQTQRTPKVAQNAVSRLPLMPAIYNEEETSEWDMDPLPHGTSFRLVTVSEYDDDFLRVKNAFLGGAKGKNFKIIKIERVENPFLLGYYLLKMSEMQRRHNTVMEQVHFHGTKQCNVNKICENNFNWKLHGAGTGNRYGQGVSFSPISYYASHYSDKKCANKIMFYVKVLVSSSVLGNEEMVIPPKIRSNSWHDTAHKDDGRVIVKFSDNEFYPEFIIHYSTPNQTQKPKKKPKVNNYRVQTTPCYDSDEYDYNDCYGY